MPNKRSLKSPPRCQPERNIPPDKGGRGGWQVYIVRCADGTLYTGIARDVVRRVAEHNGMNGRGAKYTKSRRPVALSYTETQMNRACALKREAEIKNLSKADKEVLVLSPIELSKQTL